MSDYSLKPSLAQAREHALSALCAYDKFGKCVDNLSAYPTHFDDAQWIVMWGRLYSIKFRVYKDDVIVLEVSS